MASSVPTPKLHSGLSPGPSLAMLLSAVHHYRCPPPRSSWGNEGKGPEKPPALGNSNLLLCVWPHAGFPGTPQAIHPAPSLFGPAHPGGHSFSCLRQTGEHVHCLLTQSAILANYPLQFVNLGFYLCYLCGYVSHVCTIERLPLAPLLHHVFT